MSTDTATVASRTIVADTADVCGRDGCSRTVGVELTTNAAGETRVLCRSCRKEFLGVSS